MEKLLERRKNLKNSVRDKIREKNKYIEIISELEKSSKTEKILKKLVKSTDKLNLINKQILNGNDKLIKINKKIRQIKKKKKK